MTVRIGILGCGSIARSAHLPSLIHTPGVSVVALADHDGANVAAAQAIVRAARVHRDYESVLRDPDVDAVIIALPPALHADAAIAALEHGKHVYVEKPLATTSKEATGMVAAARRTTLTAMVGFNYRFHPVVQAARARIVAGAIGTPIGIRSVFATAAKPIASWKQRRDSGGGVLLDLAVHHIDLAHYLLDSATTDVWADVRSVRTEHDTASLHLRLTSGATVSSLFSLSAVEEDRIEIYGTAGKVTIDRYGSLRAATTGPQARGAFGVAVERLVGEVTHLPAAVAKRRAPMHDPSFPAAIGAFVRAVRDRSPATPSFGDGLRAAMVVEAAESSVQSGRSVPVATPAPAQRRERTVVVSEATSAGKAGQAALSVVLITPDSFETIRQTTRCIVRQSVVDRIELVIVAPATARIDVDAALVAPLAGVQVVRLASVTPTGPARAAAIRAARAPVVAFAEEHCFPAPGWAAALVEAHRGEHAAVGPAMKNANPDSIVSWADFLIGYGPWAAPIERREMDYLPGHNSSYKRAHLLGYGDSLDTLMEAETVVMWDLRSKGHRLLLDPAASTAHVNFGLWRPWLTVSFHNGRAFADTRSASWPLVKRLAFAAGSPLIPFVRLARTLGNARRVGRGAWFLARVVPTLSVGLVVDAIGQMVGYTAGAGAAHERMAEFEWHRMQYTRRGQSAAT